MAMHLRVYPSSDESPSPKPPQRTVRVSLADLLPLVAMGAHRGKLCLALGLPG